MSAAIIQIQPPRADERPAAGRRRVVEVICLTYGEPADNGWIPQFRYSLSILNRLTRQVAPIPRAVTPLIAARRAWKRVSDFRRIGWNSPLEEISRRQVRALEAELNALDPSTDYWVRLVFEFREPYLQTVLDRMRDRPPDEIVIVPLYVADSDFTSGVSRRDLADFQRATGGDHALPAPRYAESFGYDERAGRIMADQIWSQVMQAGWTREQCRRSALILGAHGTLLRPPPGINSGARETRYLFGLVRNHLKHRFGAIRMGWLNHTLGGTWTFPEVADSARESQASGLRRVVYYPFGFLAENGESQLEGQRQLADFDWEDQLCLPCLNDAPPLTALLASRILERLEGPPGCWEEFGK